MMARRLIARWPVHLLELDSLTRGALIIAGAFGAYSLGANNIANVMGVFVPAFPARSIEVFGIFSITGTQLLFLLGGLAISVGVYSFSHRVMMTVGRGLFKLTPVTAFVVVLAEAIVLFLFASQSLESWLLRHGLPAIPLVPVSSSQAVIGAVIGIALVKGGRGVRYGVLGRVAGGWVATPAIAAVLAFLGLFFLQNVFGLAVHRPVPFVVNEAVLERVSHEGVASMELEGLKGEGAPNARQFEALLEEETELVPDEILTVLEFARRDSFVITPERIQTLDQMLLTRGQLEALRGLSWRSYGHEWQLTEALAEMSPSWRLRPETPLNDRYNSALKRRLRYVRDTFRVPLSAN